MGFKIHEVRLGDICAFRAGSAFPRDNQGKTKGDHPFIKVSDMNAPENSWIISRANNWISSSEAHDLKAKLQPKGATVFAKIGEALKADRTRLLSRPTLIDNNMMAAVPKESIDPLYLYYLITSLKLSKWAEGSALPYLKQKVLGDIVVRIPVHVEDQQRTSSILELIDRKIRINQRTNDYLATACVALVEIMNVEGTATLADISSQVNVKTACGAATIDSYVSTESLLPDKGGRQTASALPTTGKVTVYQPEDTLVSNIRPYFKKVWYADRVGTCSSDVIVFRAKEPELAPYLYSVLRSDSYFDHVMAGAKGTKMPRGDKRQMMQYPVASDFNEEELVVLDHFG